MSAIKTQVEMSIQGKKYLSVEQVKTELKNKLDREIKDRTIKQYLYNLKKVGKLFDAGRGWYSTIEQEFKLDKFPVAPLVEKMVEKYPELEFCVWSTEQIAGYYHHLPTKFSTFLYIDTNFISSIADYFRGGEYRVLKNPDPQEMTKNFFIEENPIVIRPQITEEPRDGHYATIQKIMVDLCVEKGSPAMDEGEYVRIFENLVMDHRINVAKSLRYASRRSCKEEIQNLLMAK